MAEPLSSIDNNIIVTQKPINPENPGGESTESLAPADKSPFRRIEFHQARKPFTGFTKGGGDGSFRLETLNPSSTSSNITNGNHQSVRVDSVGGGSSGKKRDASELANGWDPELRFGITLRKIGAGLENLGNTCFLNSVLQCLTYTEPLAAYLQTGKHQVYCRKAGFCALCAIQKHVSRALQSSGRSLAPKDLVSNLRCISRTFRNSRQEDAHEYMVNLLESMHKCCLPMGVSSESQNAYDKSLVHKIFGGQLRSQVECMQCNYRSNKFDPFLDLSLEIDKAENLDRAFKNFTATESLDGGAKQYQCQQCNQKVKARKQLTIHKAPNVLTVHLKRFGSHMYGHKIDKKICFGSTLDLKQFVSGPYDGDLKYTLYGVLVHKGNSTHNGHYYCFVRTSSGMWYSLDDNWVHQVSEKKVLDQKAYMLFYFRDQRSFPSKKTSDVVHHQKDTQMKTGLGNKSVNGQQAFASVGIERNGLRLNAPKDNQIKSSLSNGSLNSQKPSVPVETMRNGFRTLAPEPLGKKEVLAPKSPEGSLKCKNGDVSVPDVNLGDAASKTDKVDLVKVIGGGVEAQKEVAVLANTPELPKMESLTNSKTLVLETDKKTDNLLKLGSVTNNQSLDQETNKKAESLPKVESLTINKSLDQNTNKKEESLPKEESLTSNKTLDQTTHNKAETLPKMGSLTEKKDVDRKSKKKMKNFLKCNMAISMKFTANVLMGTSLNKRKKKKHKRTKKNKNLPQENLVNEGPSSSEKVKADELVKPPVENGFKERVSKDNAVLATNGLNGVSNGIQSNNLDSSRDNSKQKDLLNLLTRGLDERLVPRWDETESTRQSHIRESKRELTIGYIGDEWDEEYDKGKRKKVRTSKTEFDGKNPFQDIANERLNSEKPNLSKRPVNMRNNHFKRQRSRNQPRRL